MAEMQIKPIGIDPGRALDLNDPQSLARLNQIEDPRQRAEAVATQLETVFLTMMVKAMRQTVPEGGLLGKGLGGKHYVEMLDQEFARAGAAGGLDPRLHQALVRQMMQTPEAIGTATVSSPAAPEPAGGATDLPTKGDAPTAPEASGADYETRKGTVRRVARENTL